jgi:hypothetical protein
MTDITTQLRQRDEYFTGVGDDAAMMTITQLTGSLRQNIQIGKVGQGMGLIGREPCAGECVCHNLLNDPKHDRKTFSLSGIPLCLQKYFNKGFAALSLCQCPTVNQGSPVEKTYRFEEDHPCRNKITAHWRTV